MRLLVAAVLTLFPQFLMAQTQYERILVPFDTMTLRSASGTWRAELWVRNNGATPVNLLPEECFLIGMPVVCERRIDVPAQHSLRLDLGMDDPNRPGAFLFVPVDRLGDVAVNLRVRDTDRGADAIGTEIPVIRSRDMKTGVATMLNVPLETNGRTHLRIYTNEVPVASFIVRVYGEPNGPLLAQGIYRFIGPTDAPGYWPAVVDASAVFRSLIADRTRVTVESENPQLPFWPLLTITNRRNNQVTVVSPF